MSAMHTPLLPTSNVVDASPRSGSGKRSAPEAIPQDAPHPRRRMTPTPRNTRGSSSRSDFASDLESRLRNEMSGHGRQIADLQAALNQQSSMIQGLLSQIQSSAVSRDQAQAQAHDLEAALHSRDSELHAAHVELRGASHDTHELQNELRVSRAHAESKLENLVIEAERNHAAEMTRVETRARTELAEARAQGQAPGVVSPPCPFCPEKDLRIRGLQHRLESVEAALRERDREVAGERARAQISCRHPAWTLPVA